MEAKEQATKVLGDQMCGGQTSAILALLVTFLILSEVAGCINGAPLPPTPTSSRTFQPVRPDGEVEEAQCIQIAQNYVRGLGKDPLLATYEVHRNPKLDEDAGFEEIPTVAVIDVNFIDGNRWRLALKRDGDLILLAN